jgi:hypothetical protein
LQQFKDVNLGNYFRKSTCDIEQDIYRLDFDGINALSEAISSGSKKPLDRLSGAQLEDSKILWARYLLTQEGNSLSDGKFSGILKAYALHRYGGKLQVSKNLSDEPDREAFHPTLLSLFQALRQGLDAAYAASDQVEVGLLTSLERFYRGSEIFQVAGAELLARTEGKVAASG